MKTFTAALLFLCLPFSFTYGQKIKKEAELLMRLDREFDKATAEKGVDGWVAYFAPNGSMLSDTSKPTSIWTVGFSIGRRWPSMAARSILATQ